MVVAYHAIYFIMARLYYWLLILEVQNFNIGSQSNWNENTSNFSVTTVPADGLASSGAKTSAGIVNTERVFLLYIYI